jgi:hypothetical protein
MRVEQLRPLPPRRTQFAWSHHVTVPESPGCYSLVAYDGEVLYVGLASGSIRDRMGIHLDTREKRKAGPLGAPFWFYYFLCAATEVNAVERGWMNQAIMEDGTMPLLNKVYSPL